ncbi:MAG: carboxypeptidase-like regulatory domain-containing protein [Gemmataceae bacterium]
MKLRQAACHIAVIPLITLVVLGGAIVGAPGRLLPALWGPRDRAVVTGLVTKAGRPLAHATVNFHLADGRVVSASTDSEGWYEAKMPEGTMTVAVLPAAKRTAVVTGEADLASQAEGEVKPPRRVKLLPLPPPIVPVDGEGDQPATPLPVAAMPLNSSPWSGGGLPKDPRLQISLREGRQTVDLALDG